MKIQFTFFFSLLLCICSLPSLAQSISSKDLLAKSIRYHDPQGMLHQKEVTMHFIETRPGGEDRKSSISFDIQREQFQTNRKSKEGEEIISKINKAETSFSINGSSEITEEMIKKHRLDGKRLNMMKNYYQYLWLLPMKLNDPGTIIDPEVNAVDFFGKDLLQIRVTYTEEVGKDIWYFYFNPDSYALEGYRFYHDESKNDGEYILLEGEEEFKGVRLPKTRAWYTHKDAKLLGTDILDKLAF